MPQMVTVRVGRPSGRTLRFWVPVLPVALVLVPFLVLAVLVTCRIYHLSAARALVTGWRFVAALPGTRVDVAQGRTALRLSVR